MGFNVIGEAAKLCFNPYFAKVQTYVSGVCDKTNAEIGLMLAPPREGLKTSTAGGYILFVGSVSTPPTPHIHDAWHSLGYWIDRYLEGIEPMWRPRLPTLSAHPFPEEVIAASLKVPASGGSVE